MAGGARKLPIWHTIYFYSFMWGLADKYTIPRRKRMFALAMIILSGYGVGYEGYEDGKLYFGLYSPSAEYGYVLTEKEIYLDTVFIKE